MQNKQKTCLFTCMYTYFGTEKDEKREQQEYYAYGTPNMI